MENMIFKIGAKTRIQSLSAAIYNYVLSKKSEAGTMFQLRAMGPEAVAVAVKGVIKANSSLSTGGNTLYLHPHYEAVVSDKEEDANKQAVCFTAILKPINK